MEPEPHRHLLSPVRRVIIHFQTTIVAGLLVMLPIAVTVLVLKFFFDLLNDILPDDALKYLPGPQIPGLGFLILLIGVYIVGLIAARVLGRRLIDFGHSLLERIPVVRAIYGTTRTAVDILSSSSSQPYSAVVFVEFPRKGLRSIGLVTSQIGTAGGEMLLAVYVPTTPIPSSGFLIIVPESQVTRTDISVDDAMKIIISGGILGAEAFAASAAPEGSLAGNNPS